MQESIVETLKSMKSEQNLTLQQISSASGVPLSTCLLYTSDAADD